VSKLCERFVGHGFFVGGELSAAVIPEAHPGDRRDGARSSAAVRGVVVDEITELARSTGAGKTSVKSHLIKLTLT
jgi:hypothetical protein